MEETELVGRVRPDACDHLGVQRRAVRDDLCGRQTGVAEPREERLHLHLGDGPLHELVADGPIAVRRARIDREQQGQVALIDLIDAEHAGEGLHDPGAVVVVERLAGSEGAAPVADHGHAGSDPQVASEPSRDATDRHAVGEDGLHRGGADPVSVAGAGAQRVGGCARKCRAQLSQR